VLKSYLFKKYVIFYAIIVLIILVATGCKLRPEPTNIEMVEIEGIAIEGATLKAKLTPSNALAHYTWLRSPNDENFTPIEGAGNKGSYTLTSSDADHYIKVVAKGIEEFHCERSSVTAEKVIGKESYESELANALGINEDSLNFDTEKGIITITGNILVTEDTSITLLEGLSLVIGGDSSFSIDSDKTLTIDGDLVIEEDFEITGGGTVKVEGNLEGKSLKVSGGSTLVVTGDADLEEIELADDSKIEIVGGIITKTLTVTDDSDVEINGDVNVKSIQLGDNSELKIEGDLSSSNNLTISGKGLAEISGNVTTPSIALKDEAEVLISGNLDANIIEQETGTKLNVDGEEYLKELLSLLEPREKLTTDYSNKTITLSGTIAITEDTEISLPAEWQLVINEDATLTLSESKTLTVGGDLTVVGNLKIDGVLSLYGELSVGGILQGPLNVPIDEELTIKGDLTIGEDFILKGGGTVKVTGTLEGEALTVTDGSTLIVSGNVILEDIELQNYAKVTIGGYLNTDNVIQEPGTTLEISGGDYLEELLPLISGGGKLSVDNDSQVITLSGDILLEKDETVSIPDGMSLVLADGTSITSTLTNTLTINGNLEAGGNLALNGNFHVEGSLAISGNLEIDGELGVDEDFSVNGSVTGSLTVSAGKELTVKNNLTVDDNFALVGGGTLKVEETLESEGNRLELSIETGSILDVGKIGEAITELEVTGGGKLIINEDVNLEKIELTEDSSIEIDGTLSGNNLIVSGNGILVIAEDLTTTNNLSIGTNSSVEAENNITVGRDLTVGSGATLDQGGELNVTGTISGTGEILEPTSVSWEVLNDKPLEVDSTLEALVEPSIASVTYQWMVADSAEGPYSDIAGATGKTYTLTESEIGKFIRVEATGTGKYKTKVYSSNPSNDVINRVAVKGVHALVNALLGSDDFEEYNSIVKWTNSENELFTITLEEDSSLTATSSVPEKVNLVVSDTLSIGNTLTIKGKLTANKQSDITLSADWWTIEGSGVATINSEAKLTFKNNNNYINGNNAYWTIEDGTIAKFTREADKDLITFSGIGVTLNKDYDLTTLSKTVNLVGDVRATLYAKLTVKIANLKLNDNSSLVISDNGTLDSNSMFGYEHLNQNAFIDIVNGTLKKDGDSWISSTGSFYYILENTKARRNQAGFELTPINTAETSTATFKNVVTTGGDKFSIVHTPFVIDSGVTLKQDGKWASGNVTIKNGATFIISKNEHYAVQKLGVGENPQTGVTKEDFMLTIEQGATLNFQGSGNINFVKGNAIFYGGIIDIKKGAIIVIGSTEYDTSSEGFEASEMIDELKGKILNHIAIYDDVEIEDIQHTNPK